MTSKKTSTTSTASRPGCTVTLPSGRRLTAKEASLLVKPGMWQRVRTGSATKGAKDYYWAMIEVAPDDPPKDKTPVTPSSCCAGTTTPGPSAATRAGRRARCRWRS